MSSSIPTLVARLSSFATGLGLSESTTRRIVTEVEASDLESAEDRLVEVRRRMLEAAREGEDDAWDGQI